MQHRGSICPIAVLLLATLPHCRDNNAGVDSGNVEPRTDASSVPHSDLAVSDTSSVPETDVSVSDTTRPDAVAVDATAPDGNPGLDSGTPIGTWVAIPAGTFTMGSPPGEPCPSEPFLDTEVQHEVTLTRSFELQSTEVTQGEFETLMGYNPSFFVNSLCNKDCPVENVSWHEAAAYCNALSKSKQLAECYACTGSGTSVTCSEATGYDGKKIYDCPGFRLPTEAEWEYAYRAGTTTAYYSGANDPGACTGGGCQADANADPIAWYCANTKRPKPVGQKQENAWHLYDMAGNVSELCHDGWADSLGSLKAEDPVSSLSSPFRVTRGGPWWGFTRHLRAASRGNASAAARNDSTGFRCARTLTP